MTETSEMKMTGRKRRQLVSVAMRTRMEDSKIDPLILQDAPSLQWYGLLTPPGKEFVAQKILRRYGVRTFVPVRGEWRRRNKFVKTKELKYYPLAPRYVISGFPAGVPLWFDLFALPNIQGVVALENKPMRIRSDEVAKLIRRTGGALVAPEVQRYMRTHHEFKVGDIAEIVDGPFTGLKVPVRLIDGMRARVLLELFGGSVDEIEVPLEMLQAA